MAKWRSARLRRLYGKPSDPIENSDEVSASPEPTGVARPAVGTATVPPPKRVRREKTRPESEYELIHSMPVTPTPPDYSLLVNPLSKKQASVVAYAVHASRSNWLNGSMFETFWTRKPRGKKATDNQPNLRDKMTKLHECTVTLGPHTFPVKLFTVKDDNVHIDEEQDRLVEEKLTAAERERQAKIEAERQTSTVDASTEATKLDKESGFQPDDAHVGLSLSESPSASNQVLDSESNTAHQPNSSAPNSEASPAPRAREPDDGGSSAAAPISEVTQASMGDAKPPISNALPTTNQSANVDGTVTKQPEETFMSNDQQSPEADLHDMPAAPPTEPERAQTSSSDLPDSSHAPNTHNDALESVEAIPKRQKLPEAVPEQTDESMTTPEEPELRDRKRSFEMEKQNLEAEKRRVMELEMQLKGHAPSPGSGVGAAPATTLAAPGLAPSPSGDISTSSASTASEWPVAPAAPTAPPQPPPQVAVPPAPPRAVPNELVVSKLQQMAARDSTLGELMRVVASQTASHEDIVKFQEIINRVKASLFTPPPPAPKSKAKPKPKATPQLQRMPVAYQARANSKAIMLALEFDENPSERHLLPKRSIIEYLPAEGQLLWSFLHVASEQEGSKTKGGEKLQRKIYTPITATFHNIPFKVAQTLERCVRKPEIVAYYMKDVIKTVERAEPWHLWFHIEKNDEVLLESMKKMPAPTMAPPPPPRKSMKPRKTKITANNGSGAGYRRPGEPLVQSNPMIIGRRGQPMVQAPSYYQHIHRRPRINTTSRPTTGPVLPANTLSGISGTAPSFAPTVPTQSVQHMWPDQQQPIQGASVEGGFMQPPLKLPDPTSVQLPPGEMPPLPRSIQLERTQGPAHTAETATEMETGS